MKDYLDTSVYALYLKVNTYIFQLYHMDPTAFYSELAFVLGGVLAITLGLVAFVPWPYIRFKFFRLPKWLRKGDTRMPKEREISDAITSAVEQLVYDGILTRRDAQNWYKKLGTCLTLPDVVPRDLKGFKKKLIDKRLRAGLPVPASVLANTH